MRSRPRVLVDVRFRPLGREKSFGPYVLHGQIAAGGMATVYLASREDRPGSWLALKRIHPHLLERDDVRLMFENEALILSRLQHPSICGIVDWGIVGDAPYLTMQYLHGAPLSGVLKRLLEERVPLPIDLMVYVVASIADALHYAHEAQNEGGLPLDLVHRDISPQNIFVTFSGEVKLLDFGVAKATGLESLTRTGHIKGKYAYMSPEQAKGEPLDRRSDIFSLGIVLWESLTGRHLFKRKRELDTLDAIMQNVVPNPSRLNPEVPAELDRVLTRLLQLRAARRYQTGQALSEVLWSYLTTVEKPMGADEVADILMATFPDHPPPKEQANLLETKPDALRLKDHTSRLPLPSIEVEILDEVTLGPKPVLPGQANRSTLEFPKSELEHEQSEVAGTRKLPVVTPEATDERDDTDEQLLLDSVEAAQQAAQETAQVAASSPSSPRTLPPNAPTMANSMQPSTSPSASLDAPTEFVPRRSSSVSIPPIDETGPDPFDERTLGPEGVPESANPWTDGTLVQTSDEAPATDDQWLEGTEVPGAYKPGPDSVSDAWIEGTELSPQVMSEATGGSWAQLGPAESPNTTREEPVDALVLETKEQGAADPSDGVSVLAAPTDDALINWQDEAVNVAPTLADPQLKEEVAVALAQLEEETLGPKAFSDRPVVAPHPSDADVGFGELESEQQATEVAPDGGLDDASLGNAIPISLGDSDIPPSEPGVIPQPVNPRTPTEPPHDDPAEALDAPSSTKMWKNVGLLVALLAIAAMLALNYS